MLLRYLCYRMFRTALCVRGRYAYAKYNLSLGVGLSQVAGKVLRIGHLGNMDEVRHQS